MNFLKNHNFVNQYNLFIRRYEVIVKDGFLNLFFFFRKCH